MSLDKVVGMPQMQCFDKVIDVPVVQVVQVPRVQSVEKSVGMPQWQTVEKIVVFSAIQTVLSTQTSESFGHALVRQAAQATITEVLEVGSPPPPQSSPTMFITVPGVQAPQVVMKSVHPASEEHIAEEEICTGQLFPKEPAIAGALPGWPASLRRASISTKDSACGVLKRRTAPLVREMVELFVW